MLDLFTFVRMYNTLTRVRSIFNSLSRDTLPDSTFTCPNNFSGGFSAVLAPLCLGDEKLGDEVSPCENYLLHFCLCSRQAYQDNLR